MLEIRTEPLAPADWLDVIGREYFAGFLSAGGAAAKFAIADDVAAVELQSEAAALAHRHGMLSVRLAGDETKLHMAQELFFAVARALPWDRLLQHYLEDLFARNAHPWPRPGHAMRMNDLAEAFGIAPGIMTRHRDQWVSRDLWDDARLTRDFRAAMISLCLTRLDPHEDGAGALSPVHRWMFGEKPAMNTLRDHDISARIGRSNARAMLISLCHFLTRCGTKGLLLTLDLRPAAKSGKQAAGPVKYTLAAVMDLYEVLRELIDDLEHLPGLFILGIADRALIAGDPKRTLDTYKALEMRIWPDVRPGDRQNPLAPLVMVGA